MRLVSIGSALLCSAVAGCVANTSSATPIELDDPLGLVSTVAGFGNPLRVYVLPAAQFQCQTSTGTTTPDVPDLPVGTMAPGVQAEVVLPLTMGVDMANAMATVPTGDWTVLVRGKGTDPVSHRTNRIIASGCAPVMGLGASETRAVHIVLMPLQDMGMCGDGTLSPDEQCEASMTPTDCTACRTTSQQQSTPTTTSCAGNCGPAHGVHVASSTGQRVALAWTIGNGQGVGARFLDVESHPLPSGVFSQDFNLRGLGGSAQISGIGGGGWPSVASDGHIAIAEHRLPPSPDDVQVAFFDSTPSGIAASPTRTDTTGTRGDPSIAYSGTALLATFVDSHSATGISGRAFAAGSTTASGAEAFAIGTGQTGATHPVVAGSGSGFVVVFAAATDVWFQRFGQDGSPTDAAAMPVLMGADAADMQDQPAVAANSDGSFLVAWNEHSTTNGDGMGTTIRARAFAASGAAMGAAVVVPTTVAGDQTAPTVAAADGHYLVAWASGGDISACVLAGNAVRLPNREQPPAAADFVVSAAGNAPSATAMGLTTPSWLITYDDGTNAFTRRYPR
jgi:hypothetical protein